MCLAIPGQIQDIQGEDLLRSATVDFGGVSRSVSLACVPEAVEGDWVLVHVGMACNVEITPRKDTPVGASRGLFPFSLERQSNLITQLFR